MMMRKSARKGAGATHGDIAFEPQLPYPNGWFCICFSDALKPGKSLTVPLAGKDVVVYRTRTGVVRIIQPFCPHLGAHLGVVGSVAGEEMVCGFHGFAFSVDGSCTRNGYGTKPPKANLVHLPLFETAGIIWGWHHDQGMDPTWQPSEVAPEDSPRAHRTWDFVGHPQELMENIVDTGHLTPLHGLGKVVVVKPLEISGENLAVRIRFPGAIPFLRMKELDQDIRMNGLGRMVSTSEIPVLGITIRVFSCVTPIAPWRTRFSVGVSVVTPKMRFMPTSLHRSMAGLFARLAVAHLAGFVEDDDPIWQYKKYLAHPRLAAGDGPIVQFRRWAAQFYPGS